MDISNKVLDLRNKAYAKMLLHVVVEGDAKENFYPDKFIIINKNTGEKWSVEFDTKPYHDPDGISPTEWYATLSDGLGKVLETKDINRYPGRTIDNIAIGKSGYASIWNIVNTKFKEFQRKHYRIKEKESSTRDNPSVINSMQHLRNFLRR